MKAAFYTLGCKVNQYETEEMTEQLIKDGFLIVDSKEDADVYIVNSCTVTAESNRKTRQAVRRFKSNHPSSVVVLTGCVPQAFPDEASGLIQADIILGNKKNYMLSSEIKRYFKTHSRINDIEEHENHEKYSGGIITRFQGHTRAFVKIQDGCNRFCSYCIIPQARGRSRSKPMEDIKAELNALSKEGFSEVVFVGINLSAYGHDTGTDIAEPIIAAENTDGIKRIRLGSLEPDHMTDEVIEKIASCKKFCPQFHISLQSGSDSVLKRMNRHYDSEEYEHLANKLRSTFSDCSLTTDIIVGFPGETDEEFNQTVEFAKRIGFEKVHVFPYSVREGTRAAKMTDQITQAKKEERAAALTKACEEIRSENFKKLKGKTFSVLFEKPKNGYQCGYTKNYTPVRVLSDECLTGKIADVKITTANGDYCDAVLL